MKPLANRRTALASLAGALACLTLPKGAVSLAGSRALSGEAISKLRELREGTLLRLLVHREGVPLPSLPFFDEIGNETMLADWRGKVLVVNFWATWCPPCRLEMPSLDRLQENLGGEDFEVLAISQDRDGAEKARKFYDSVGIAHLAVHVDEGGALARKVKVLGLPATLLVDRAGNEVARLTGEARWDAEEVQRMVRRMIELA